jgi:hypothetical protein
MPIITTRPGEDLVAAYRRRSLSVQGQLLAGKTLSEIVQTMRVSRAVVQREIQRLQQMGALDEQPDEVEAAEARVEREVKAGTRCGCGLLKPHDFLQRLSVCT